MDEKAVSALAQPTRKQILDALMEKETHASDLARKLDIDRPTICYHLSRLEEASLITGKYVILQQNSPGRAAKIYVVNKDKYSQVIQDAKHLTKLLETT